jgi:hypothetical protein
LLIRNEEIPWESCPFLLQILIKPLLDLINGDIDLRDLLHHTSTAINTGSFITNLLVKENCISSDVFDDLFPLSLPTEELLALLGQHLEGVGVAIEEALILVPNVSKLKDCLDDFLNVLIVSNEVLCLYFDGLRVLIVEHRVQLAQIEMDLLLDFQILGEDVDFSLFGDEIECHVGDISLILCQMHA